MEDGGCLDTSGRSNMYVSYHPTARWDMRIYGWLYIWQTSSRFEASDKQICSVRDHGYYMDMVMVCSHPSCLSLGTCRSYHSMLPTYGELELKMVETYLEYGHACHA